MCSFTGAFESGPSRSGTVPWDENVAKSCGQTAPVKVQLKGTTTNGARPQNPSRPEVSSLPRGEEEPKPQLPNAPSKNVESTNKHESRENGGVFIDTNNMLFSVSLSIGNIVNYCLIGLLNSYQ